MTDFAPSLKPKEAAARSCFSREEVRLYTPAPPVVSDPGQNVRSLLLWAGKCSVEHAPYGKKLEAKALTYS
jgi:hypothetical protein